MDDRVERQWRETEQQIEDGMRDLLQSRQITTGKSDTKHYDSAAQRLAADLAVVHDRRELYEAFSWNSDLVREKGCSGLSDSEKEDSVLRICLATDRWFFSEVRAWRLYTFAPPAEVSMQRRVWLCNAMLLKAVAYVPMRIITTPALWILKDKKDEKPRK